MLQPSSVTGRPQEAAAVRAVEAKKTCPSHAQKLKAQLTVCFAGSG